MSKTAKDIYENWYNSLDEVDRELVDKVDIVQDDDYPLQPRGKLSAAAERRGGIVEYTVTGGIATLAYVPQPPAEYFEALEREKEQQAQQEEQQRESAIASFETWKRQNLDGLTPVYFYPRGIVPNKQDRIIRFGFEDDFGWDKTMAAIEINGETCWIESSGAATHIYVPHEQAVIWWQEKWDNVENKAREAWDLLDSYLSGDTTYGSGYRRWLRDTLTIAGIIDLARQYVPQHTPPYLFSYGSVSRAYRLPVSDENGNLGFGTPGETLARIQARVNGTRRAEEIHRQQGWITESDATDEDFWTEHEILARRARMGNRY